MVWKCFLVLIAAAFALIDLDNTVYVSAASEWEIATQYRFGKLREAEPFVHSLCESIEKQGFKGLSASLRHAQRARAIGMRGPITPSRPGRSD